MSLCLWTANCTRCFLCRRPLMKYVQRTGQFPIRWHLSFQLQLRCSSVVIDMWYEVRCLNLGLRELTSLQHFVVSFSTSKRTQSDNTAVHMSDFAPGSTQIQYVQCVLHFDDFYGFFCPIVDTKPCPEIGHYRLYVHRCWFIIHNQPATIYILYI